MMCFLPLMIVACHIVQCNLGRILVKSLCRLCDIVFFFYVRLGNSLVITDSVYWGSVESYAHWHAKIKMVLCMLEMKKGRYVCMTTIVLKTKNLTLWNLFSKVRIFRPSKCRCLAKKNGQNTHTHTQNNNLMKAVSCKHPLSLKSLMV